MRNSIVFGKEPYFNLLEKLIKSQRNKLDIQTNKNSADISLQLKARIFTNNGIRKNRLMMLLATFLLIIVVFLVLFYDMGLSCFILIKEGGSKWERR